MGKVVAVTGGNGFLGSYLVKSLLNDGYDVRCLVRSTSKLQSLEGLDITYCYGELSKGEGLTEFLKDADYVVHLAAQTVGLNREELQLPNIDSVRFLLEGIRNLAPNLRKCVFISSQEAIHPSQTDSPLNEEDHTEPFTDYGWSKYQAEKLFIDGDLPFPWVILRPGPVYGPRDKDLFMLFSSLFRGFEPRMMFTSKISFVYVGNVVHYILKALQSDISHDYFFVSDGNSMQSKDFARLIINSQQKKVLVLPIVKPLLFLAALLGSLRMNIFHKRSILNLQKYKMMTKKNLAVDPSKLQEIFGLPPCSTEEGVGETHRWYLEHGWYKSKS